MNPAGPDWGGGSRFYLPNEDAGVVRAALGYFRPRARRPVFVGGSGMMLLEAAAGLPRLQRATFVDVADFQCDYFHRLRRALAGCATPGELRTWFADTVYPELCRHHQARGRAYGLEQVLEALRQTFRLRFFFDPAAFRRAQAVVDRVVPVRADIAGHLAATPQAHDFIYASNVPDYLGRDGLAAFFAACRGHAAPVYLLLTSACADPEAVRQAWEAAGYAPHPAAKGLDARNRGLGSPRLARPWNRPGTVHLLVPQDARSTP
ncbi:MAG: hypothetical protein ACP59X_18815 [Solidesulfovibrio sp. DCME]|uniref:hypothetical protein n=1 Tax=Solidesulfovibrio sp. DCME TaxID=3447380 RepID=UPI003D0A783D